MDIDDFGALAFSSTASPYTVINNAAMLDLAPEIAMPMDIDGFAPPAHHSLHNPFSSRAVSHLPTPQSPGDMAPYVALLTDLTVPQHSMSPSRRPVVHTLAPQMVTPESSPHFSRWALPENNVSPTRRSSPHTPPPVQQASSPPSASDPPLLVRTPPPIATNSLSSPFSPHSHLQPLVGATSYSPIHSPTQPDSVSSPSSSSAALNAGGELERIRIARAMMQQETESRRPDYLQRTTTSGAAVSGPAGIAESPMKGRRIELFGFTETSEESFEERLMAGGYVGYGSTRGATEAPTTPVKSLNELLATSAPATTSKPSADDGGDVDEAALDDKARRKRRRLQAFKSEGRKKSKAIIHPVELEHTGRVIIDLFVEKEEPSDQPETPKRKGGRRRKPRPKGARVPPGAAPTGEPGLHWPDEQFPWSVRAEERRAIDRMEEAENLKHVASYLDSDNSDSEDAEDPVPALDHVNRFYNFEFPPHPPPPGRGLGKSIPQPDAARRSIYIPSDPADARSALLAKRVVRELIAARREQAMTLCICGKGDNGQDQVQCDDCKRWYHLACLGIPSVDDLGPEETPWFCYACVDDGRGRRAPVYPHEPAFARDEYTRAAPGTRDPLFYDAASPAPATEPRTPTPAPAARVRVYESQALTPVGGIGEPFDPSSTPSRGLRNKDGSGTWDRARYGAPFTPHNAGAMPVRGAFTTPTAAARAMATPRAAATLPRAARFSGQYVPASAGGMGMGMGMSVGAATLFDDTPVDRAAPRAGPVVPRAPRTVADSPLMGREGHKPAVVVGAGADGSPSLRPAQVQARVRSGA